jgi:drug/metabolite transporter (DMT)-like permease
VLTALLSTVLLSEHMTWRKAAGLVLGVGGVAFVVESRISGGAESVAGIACVVAALMSLVAGTILFNAPTEGRAVDWQRSAKPGGRARGRPLCVHV